MCKKELTFNNLLNQFSKCQINMIKCPLIDNQAFKFLSLLLIIKQEVNYLISKNKLFKKGKSINLLKGVSAHKK